MEDADNDGVPDIMQRIKPKVMFLSYLHHDTTKFNIFEFAALFRVFESDRKWFGGSIGKTDVTTMQ